MTHPACDRAREVISGYAGAAAEERSMADLHLASCADCQAFALEIRQLEKVLQSWTAPPVPSQLPSRVLAALRAGDPLCGCEEVAGLVHELVAGTLPAVQSARLCEHIEDCRSCQELEHEASELSEVLVQWQAPDPPAHLARSVVSLLAPPASATRTISPPWWSKVLFGEVRMPRLAAALLLLTTALSLLNLWRAPREGAQLGPTQGSLDAPHVPLSTQSGDLGGPGARPTLRTLSLYRSEPGAFDPAESFSARYLPSRGHLLRAARQR